VHSGLYHLREQKLGIVTDAAGGANGAGRFGSLDSIKLTDPTRNREAPGLVSELIRVYDGSDRYGAISDSTRRAPMAFLQPHWRTTAGRDGETMEKPRC
jgi:hypothetical protein